MVIAPEHELVEQIKTDEHKQAVDEYLAYVKSRSERERMAEKKITGVFTGAYAINPLSGKEIPIWISEYVLAGMAPALLWVCHAVMKEITSLQNSLIYLLIISSVIITMEKKPIQLMMQNWRTVIF
jgi:leucyl-tRNA synthetase